MNDEWRRSSNLSKTEERQDNQGNHNYPDDVDDAVHEIHLSNQTERDCEAMVLKIQGTAPLLAIPFGNTHSSVLHSQRALGHRPPLALRTTKRS